MNLREWQVLASRNYKEKGYTNDPVTLALGVCEEAGELGKAVNWYHNPLYKRNPGSHAHTVEHEIGDLLLYLAALANSLGVDLQAINKIDAVDSAEN